MAGKNIQILLGFEDELITDKNKHLTNFKTNKIGGKPDIPNNIKFEIPTCSLCNLPQILVVQIYAPLENSTHHRTLYVFACINPNCWNQNESWTCLRVQTQETLLEEATNAQIVSKSNTNTTFNWCSDADDWDDDDNANENEKNGNLINPEHISDDESYSLDDSLRAVFGNLSVDDKNANIGALGGGAVGRQHSPSASAEIEGDEGEVVTIDSPTMPQYDIHALLNETDPLPYEIANNTGNHVKKISPTIFFQPYFMSVWEETCNIFFDNHVKELLTEYQKNEDFNADHHPEIEREKQNENEKYEKTLPAHGDKMFHYFLTRIQRNPGQILRYCREMEPLLIYPQMEQIKRCQYCQDEKVFEFQILPTIISKLKLNADSKYSNRLEFGTVLIYTCRNNCWANNSIRYETVVVQKELF